MIQQKGRFQHVRYQAPVCATLLLTQCRTAQRMASSYRSSSPAASNLGKPHPSQHAACARSFLLYDTQDDACLEVSQ